MDNFINFFIQFYQSVVLGKNPFALNFHANFCLSEAPAAALFAGLYFPIQRSGCPPTLLAHLVALQHLQLQPGVMALAPLLALAQWKQRDLNGRKESLVLVGPFCAVWTKGRECLEQKGFDNL